MSATITHAYIAKDLYEVLPTDIANKIDLKRTMMFAQSTDSLMFYNLFSILPGKKIRKFQKYFHTHKVNDFFINLLEFTKKNEINDSDTYSFIVGFICHYVLDSTVHPYVIYKTGMFDRKNRNTYKYNNVHAFMESFLDNDMIRRRENTNPYKFKINKFCFNTKKFSKNLNSTIDYTFSTTFGLKDMSKIYRKSLKQMRWSLMRFRRDPYGIKRFFYKLIDTITPRSAYRFEAISYHYPLEDKHNFLNNNHNIWRNPCEYDLVSTESYVDLYLKALNDIRNIVIKSFDYLNGEDIDLSKLFLNKNYVTGLDCDIEREIKYFEF